MRMYRTLVLALVLVFVATACEEKGPAERLGEKVDNAAEQVQEGAEDVGDAIEDACEDVKEEAGADDTDC